MILGHLVECQFLLVAKHQTQSVVRIETRQRLRYTFPVLADLGEQFRIVASHLPSTSSMLRTVHPSAARPRDTQAVHRWVDRKTLHEYAH